MAPIVSCASCRGRDQQQRDGQQHAHASFVVASSGLLEQLLPFGPQPAPGLDQPRADGGHQPPESRRVIQLATVHQLVQHDVLADEIRHQRQPPVEA